MKLCDVILDWDGCCCSRDELVLCWYGERGVVLGSVGTRAEEEWIYTRDEYWDHYITIIDTLHVKLAGLLIIKQLSVSHNSHTILIRYENLCEKYFAKPLNTDNLRLNNLIIQIVIRLLNLGFPGAVAVYSLSRKA